MEQKEYKGSRYPKECCSVVRDKTLAITPELSLATAADGFSPAKVYNSFSRFTFVIINEAKVAVSANIPLDEFENIKELTHIAQMIDVKSSVSPEPVVASAEIESIEDSNRKMLALANNARIANGTLKGKTPAEVLIEDSESGVKLLLSQREWLKKNLEKYPGNQKQIDSIEAALTLFKAGTLTVNRPDSTSSLNGKEIVLYKAEYRPLVRKKREDGKCPVYHITIKWCIGQTYPVVVRITNYFAPVIKNAQGLFNVQATKAEDRVDTEMCLLASEWNNAIRSLKTSMLQFEVFNARNSILDAEDADRKNRSDSQRTA